MPPRQCAADKEGIHVLVDAMAAAPRWDAFAAAFGPGSARRTAAQSSVAARRTICEISGRLHVGRSDKGLSRALGIRLGRGARIWKAQEQARSAEPSVFGPLGSENASTGAMLWCRRAASPTPLLGRRILLTRKADTPWRTSLTRCGYYLLGSADITCSGRRGGWLLILVRVA